MVLYKQDEDIKRICLEIIRSMCIDKNKSKQILDHGFLHSLEGMLAEDNDISDTIVAILH